MMAPTSEPAALLAAIHDDPEDDGPRLVLADWLEEQGDPHSELIRVQCALENMDRGDPRWKILFRREEDLLRRQCAAWRGNLPQEIEVWFERGLPWLNVRTAELLAEDSVARWFMAHPGWVFDLHLNEADDESFRGALGRGVLEQVPGLNLFSDPRTGPRLTDAGLQHLARLTQLRDLYLHATGLTSAGLRHLTGLSQLRLLSLGGVQVTAAGLEHLAGLTQLQKLYLYRVTGAGLEHLAGLTQLRELILHAPLTGLKLEHLAGLTQLQELGLRGRKVTDAGLEHLAGLTQLEELHLEGTRVTDAVLGHLAGLTQLQIVCLDRTQVTKAGIRKLKKALPGCHITCR